jgi:hypothetical protein
MRQDESQTLSPDDFDMTLPLPTSQETQTIALYSAIMEEMKLRTATINTLVGGKTGLFGPLVQETCYLQFRFMCELIALGCLVAHKDIDATQTNKFQKEYSADKILKQLEELHPDYYPFPSTITVKPSGVAEIFIHKSGNFLTKVELIDLYGKCGDHLHRGSLKKLLSSKTPTQVNFHEMVAIAQKFENLLSVHTIARLGGNPLVCILRTIETDGRVQVSILGPGPPPQPSP